MDSPSSRLKNVAGNQGEFNHGDAQGNDLNRFEGNDICSQIPSYLIKLFDNKLEEQKVYIFKYFKITPPRGGYRVVANKCEIDLKWNDREILLDVIGHLIEYSETFKSSGNPQKDIEIKLREYLLDKNI
ncbi:hypothetical protein LINGRAHAP2_LOCUS14266 [Linum grandiflorum]